MDEGHKHEFGGFKLYPITKKLNKDYLGSAGDRAFIYKKCQCGKSILYDYGPTKDMQIKMNDWSNNNG